MSIHDLTQLKDAELVRYAQHEEPNAARVLYERKNKKVLDKLVRKVVHGDEDKVNDAEQDTWADILYRFHAHPDEEIKNFDALLRTIGYRKAINTLRRTHTVSTD